jgi:hypothetical protein
VPQLLPSVAVLVSQPFDGLLSQSAVPAGHAVPHVPFAQIFGLVHVTPHPPQLADVSSGVSHPFARFASQFPKPELHATNVHVPVVHVALAFVNVHAMPHAPQSVFVTRAVSQPFAGLASQSPKPEVHEGAQRPFVQAVVPCVFAQASPQRPQLVVVSTAVSQPFPSTMSQSP